MLKTASKKNYMPSELKNKNIIKKSDDDQHQKLKKYAE